MVNVVILGGGFAGVSAALTLKKKIISDIHITLIDQNSFHTFTPALYEVAASEEPQMNVRIPYRVIFNKGVEIAQGKIQKIDLLKQIVFLEDAENVKKEYLYNYLIFALGSESSDFGITGVKEYGIPLKTLGDAIHIKNSLKNAKKVIIGGGGFAGTEIACELSTHRGHLLDITLIQRSQILLKELGGGISDLAKKRLEKVNVHLMLGERIEEVKEKFVKVTSGKTFLYDVFIWTGGVKSNNLLGEIKVNDYLQVNNLKNVFAAGDAVSPGVARRAITMGKIAAKNVLRDLMGKPLLPYNYHNVGYLVPLGSHFATFAMGKYHISGIPAYILQQLIFLRYLLQILPFFEALKRFRRFERDLIES